MGDVPLGRATANEKLDLIGDKELIKTMSKWFGLMPFSHVKPKSLAADYV
jgi:hypothetical protein